MKVQNELCFGWLAAQQDNAYRISTDGSFDRGHFGHYNTAGAGEDLDGYYPKRKKLESWFPSEGVTHVLHVTLGARDTVLIDVDLQDRLFRGLRMVHS